MIKYRGHFYRLALTPQQKEKKREYLLQQQRKLDQLPSFEDVVEAHLFQLETDAEEFSAALFSEVEDWSEEEVLEYLEDHGISVKPNPDFDQLRQEVRKNEVLEELKAELEADYEGAVDRVTRVLQDQECWRAVTVPKNVDPTQHTNLGIYWAYEEHAAEAHWGEPGKNAVTYHAEIDLDYVDKAGTIFANTWPRLGEEEAEVRFYKGSPIFVYDVELKDGTVLDINDWRRT